FQEPAALIREAFAPPGRGRGIAELARPGRINHPVAGRVVGVAPVDPVGGIVVLVARGPEVVEAVVAVRVGTDPGQLRLDAHARGDVADPVPCDAVAEDPRPGWGRVPVEAE